MDGVKSNEYAFIWHPPSDNPEIRHQRSEAGMKVLLYEAKQKTSLE
jgi:hypothetical protein